MKGLLSGLSRSLRFLPRNHTTILVHLRSLIPRPTGSRSGSTVGFVPRPYDFWKDFQVQVFSDDKNIRPFSSRGHPNYICSDDGGCTLTGATLFFDLLAKSFESDSATVDITPPEGDPVSVDFDLSSLR